MIEKRFNLRTIPEKWQLWIDLNATTTILLKGAENNYLLQMQKDLMKSVFVAPGSIQVNRTKQDPVQRNPIQVNAHTRMHMQESSWIQLSFIDSQQYKISWLT